MAEYYPVQTLDLSSVSRPVMRYHGGKFRLAPWVIEHFPPHEVYVEPFGGGAGVLLRKSPSCVEVYNDLNGRVVNVFAVLRDAEKSARLVEMLRATPYAEGEYRAAREVSDDPVEDARRMIVLGHQGHGSTACAGGRMSGWRRGVRPRGPASTKEWSELWGHVGDWADRMRGVYVESGDAIGVMTRWDAPSALHYIDPPYPACVRTSGEGKRGYAHEMTDAAHVEMLEFAGRLKGAVVISGYACPLYDEILSGWRRVDRAAMADAGARRVEVLWIKAREVAV